MEDVLKRIVLENKSTEHFDQLIDILVRSGMSELEAIRLFNLAVKESTPDEDIARELEKLHRGYDA